MYWTSKAQSSNTQNTQSRKCNTGLDVITTSLIRGVLVHDAEATLKHHRRNRSLQEKKGKKKNMRRLSNVNLLWAAKWRMLMEGCTCDVLQRERIWIRTLRIPEFATVGISIWQIANAPDFQCTRDNWQFTSHSFCLDDLSCHLLGQWTECFECECDWLPKTAQKWAKNWSCDCILLESSTLQIISLTHQTME